MRVRTLALVAVASTSVAAGAQAAPTARDAATANVQVVDFSFRPGYTRIEPGDTVTWSVGANATFHTVTSRRGAPEAFDSGEVDPGGQFSRAFTTAGRYPYLCRIHTEMRGVVQVGPDVVDPVLARARASVGSRSVRVSFRLSEASRVSASVASTAKPRRALRRARAKQLQDGRRSVSIGIASLDPGRYRATVSARDPEGNVGTARVAFRIP
jgi:plastocyanin